MRSPWAAIRLFILWLVLVGSLVVLFALYTPLDQWLAGPLTRDEIPQSADVIIVLGGGVVKEINFLPFGPQERIQKGIELYREGYADHVIMTGGVVKGETYTESQYMRDYAELLGLPSDVIIEESQARDTYENALYSLQIMEEQDWHTALVVTSYFHTRRACNVFAKQDANITCIAAYPSEAFQHNPFRNYIEFRSIIRDYLATVYYGIKGYL